MARKFLILTKKIFIRMIASNVARLAGTMTVKATAQDRAVISSGLNAQNAAIPGSR